jgi:regulator of sigma E protease
MGILQTLLATIVTLGILVTIHEWGHFWVARRCGVKVLRFSVGFGKPIWMRKGRDGTEYAVAAIPLGGYVRMLDEREGDVPEALLNQSFTRKSVTQRNFIAAAGPFANFIFAVVAYWFLFMVGTQGQAPVLGEVSEASPAQVAGLQSGDEIVAVDGETTSTWKDVSWQLLPYIGETTSIALDIHRDGARQQVEVKVERWLSEMEGPDPLRGLGFAPRRIPVPARVGEVVPESAAQAAGFLAGDKVVAVNGESLPDWYALVEHIKASASAPMLISIERSGARQELILTPSTRKLDDGSVIGFAGMAPQAVEFPQEWIRTSHAGPGAAFLRALSQTGDLIFLTLDSLWKMIAGDLSVKNLSGPITIAKVAGVSASGGLESFIQFLALLSVSLGVLNLLPVPMLDGGHILFNLAEAVTGKPLPERVQTVAMQMGIVMLFSLMAVAFYNDIGRL